MKTPTHVRLRWIFKRGIFRSQMCGTIAVMVSLLAATDLRAMPEVGTLTGGPSQNSPNFYGYVDGNTETVAQFHTPYGLALDKTGNYLFVADRDNNAIRELDIAGNQTFTFAPNPVVSPNVIRQPVGVAVDNAGNVYVLNRGNGLNGNVVIFDTYGDLLGTNAVALTNATGIALDSVANIYVAVQGNRLIKITPAGAITNVATITNANTSLQGIIVKHNGTIAACDSGNNGIWIINPETGAATKLTGFNGVGDYTGVNNHGAPTSQAKFNQPYGVAEAGDGSLIVTDTGNNRVKVVVNSSVITTNLYGVSSSLWYTGPESFPGWWDGTVFVPDSVGDVEARLPVGVVFAPNGTVYVTEDYYHLIRQVTGAGLPLPPPPPPPVPPPSIGWVDFPPTAFRSILHPGSSFVFNNDTFLAILPGTNASQVFFTSGATPTTGSIPDPSPGNGNTPPFYADGYFQFQLIDLPGTRFPDMTIKAIGTKNDGSPNSVVVQARIQFVVGNPIITGNNAAQFTVTNITDGAVMWYTLDGTDPTNSPPSIGPVAPGAQLSFNTASNLLFKIRGFRNGYQPSGVTSNLFSQINYAANQISFGFANDEASSDFVAAPGQTFFAPVTLTILPSTKMYSLQFNVTVTNLSPNPNPVAPGAFGFESMLLKPATDTNFPGLTLYTPILPMMFNGSGFTSLLVTNTSFNLLGVGWLERFTQTNLYNTPAQTLITFSMAHDVLYPNAVHPDRVIVGGYGFLVPSNAVAGNRYEIQIGRPSATSDGIGGPGSDVVIDTPSAGSKSNGAINATKWVTVGQRKYIVGDVYPFRWFNAGDFGNLPPAKCPPIVNADVMQVFQSAVYDLNHPPSGSDFEDGMNSCCGVYTNTGVGYLTLDPSATAAGNLFDGNDTNINSIAFGTTNSSGDALDVTDVYVTFRRSLDPSLVNFYRFWTNNGSGAVLGADFAPNSNCTNPVVAPAPAPASAQSVSGVAPAVSFSAADIIGSAGQQVQVPITARIQGSYPIKVLMLNLTVQPLDGSPAITSSVQFSSTLGAPTTTDSRGSGNYAAVWLNKSAALSGSNVFVGTLTFTIPAGAGANAAYAIHFDHVSASPNGLASFPVRANTGLATVTSRSASSWGDNISDAWRLRYFGSINNVLSAPTADADGDGLSNQQEFYAGTNPNDSNSHFKLKSAKANAAADFVVRWPSVAGKQYVLERAASPYQQVWKTLSTNTGTGFDMEYHDTKVTGDPYHFYRVRLLP